MLYWFSVKFQFSYSLSCYTKYEYIYIYMFMAGWLFLYLMFGYFSLFITALLQILNLFKEFYTCVFNLEQ